MIRVVSNMSASNSLLVTIVSSRAILLTIIFLAGDNPDAFVKYDDTRDFRLVALPTYSTSPFASKKVYTPGLADKVWSWRCNYALRSLAGRSGNLLITKDKILGLIKGNRFG